MAKRNNKMGMVQQKPVQPKRRAPVSKSGSKPARAGSARAFNRPAQPAPSTSAVPNLFMVRLAAIVIGVASLVGGIIWAVSLQGNFGTPEIIGFIVLAFLAGLGLVVAIRTGPVVANVTRMIRERRG